MTTSIQDFAVEIAACKFVQVMEPWQIPDVVIPADTFESYTITEPALVEGINPSFCGFEWNVYEVTSSVYYEFDYTTRSLLFSAQ